MSNSDIQHSFLIFSKDTGILKYFFQKCNNKTSLQQQGVSNGNFLISNCYYKEIGISSFSMHRWKKWKNFLLPEISQYFEFLPLILLTSSIPRRISLILTWANRLENGNNNQPLLLITSAPKSEFSKVFYSTPHSAKAGQWHLGIQTSFPVLSILFRVSKSPIWFWSQPNGLQGCALASLS